MKKLLLALALLFSSQARAADQTVASMNAASALTGAELLYCVQSAANAKCTVSQIGTYFQTLTFPAANLSAGAIPSSATVNNANWSGTVLSVVNGGTGTSTPSLVQGSNVTISGSWPNQTISATGGTGTITANSTATSGFSSGQILYNGAGNAVAGENAIPFTPYELSSSPAGTYAGWSSYQGGLVDFTFASGGTVNLPSATASGLFSGWAVAIQCNSASSVSCVLTPASGQINGASTLTLTAGNGVTITTDGTNANWRVSGVLSGGSGAVSSVSNSDGTLTISPTTGAVVGSLNTSHANTWTATQTFSGVTMSGLTGSTQCLQVNSSGQIGGTGSTCGSGGGGMSSFSAGFGTSNAQGGGTGTTVSNTNNTLYLDPTQFGFGVRNRLINSGMMIDQVNAGGSYTVGATVSTTAGYTLDQWIVWESAAGAGVTAQQQAIRSGGVNYALQVTHANTSNTNTAHISQVLPTNSGIDLQGQAITLSFRARVGSAWAGTSFTAAIKYGTGTDQSAANFAAGSWSGQASCGSATPTLTTTWAFYVVNCTLSSSATQLAVDLSYALSGSGAANDYIQVTDVELYPGTVAAAAVTPERPSYRMALADCQYYFFSSYAAGTAVGTTRTAGQGAYYHGFSTAQVNWALTMQFPTTMRSIPAVTTYDNAGTSGVISYFASSAWHNGGAITSTQYYSTSMAAFTATTSASWINFDYTLNSRL